MRILINYALSISLLLSPIQASALNLKFWELLPAFSKDSAGAAQALISDTADLGQMLRANGFNDEAISFALQASRGTVDIADHNTVMASVTSAGRSSLLQLAAASRNAKAIARLMKRRQLRTGTIVGAIAAGLLITEGIYATRKTMDSYETELDAYVTNFVRVGVITGTTSFAVDQLSRQGRGHKIAGLLFATAAVYTLVSGTGQIALENMDSITAKEIEEASLSLERIIAEEEALVETRRAQRAQLITERAALQADRADLTTAKVPTELIDRRGELAEELERLQLQRQAYDINIKEGSLDLDYAQELRGRGFEHVGINNDGDGSNDSLYRDTLLPNSVTNIARVETELESTTAQINALSQQAGSSNMSAAEQQRLDQIDASIARMSTQIDELTADDDAILAVRLSKQRANEYLNDLRAQGIAADTNLWEKFGNFANSEAGLRAIVNGTYFGLLSIIGGVAVHQAIHILINKGFIPRDIPGSLIVNGIQVSQLTNRNYVRSVELQLSAYRQLFHDAQGVQSLFSDATSSVVRSFQEAVDLGVRAGHIDANDARKASQTMSAVVANLQTFTPPLQADFLKSVQAAAGTLQITLGEWFSRLIGIGRAAKLGRLTGNVPVVGGLIGGGAVYATNMMFAQQAQAAAQVLSEDAYEAYMSEVQGPAKAMIMGDIAVSVVDPTFLTLPLTMGVEAVASGLMTTWMDKHAPYLPQNLGYALSPSLFGGKTVSSEVINALVRRVPVNTEGQASVLHGAIVAKNLVFEFTRDNPRPSPSYASSLGLAQERSIKVSLWEARFNAVREVFMGELKKVLADKGNLPTVLGLYSPGEKLSIIERLAESDTELDSGTRGFEKIAAFFNYQQQWSPQVWGENPRQALRRDEVQMNKYILTRMGYYSEDTAAL